MNLLYIKAYHDPEDIASSYLTKNVIEAFNASGIRVFIYTPTPSRGVTKEVRRKYKQIRVESQNDGKLIIRRFKLFPESSNVLFRIVRYFLLCLIELFMSLFYKESKRCSVLYAPSTPPTIGAIAGLVKKLSNKKFVYNLQDIFPDSLVGTGLAKKGGLLWKIGRVIENFTYRNADKIIVISEDFKRNIMAKGVPEEKIEVIYNWVDEEAVVDIPRTENKLFDKYGLDRDKFYVTYNGNIGLTQNMDMLLEVAKELQEPAAVQEVQCPSGGSSGYLPHSFVHHALRESTTSVDDLRFNAHGGSRDIHFVLVGEGAYKAEVEKRIKEQGITNVTLLPFQPYEDISHVFSLGDVSLVISKPGVGANSVPSKTWSIMSASRPVLANFDENELKTIIEEHQCGIFTKAGDKEAFKEAILKLYNNPELCREYGKNGRQFVMDNLTKDVGTRKYVEVIKAVVEH